MHWLHGTPTYFERWISPPPPPPGLHPLSFLSLSADPRYALMHRGAQGGLCSARLMADARVLDLRRPSPASARLWQLLRHTPLGRGHAGLRDEGAWYAACADGSLLRYVAANPGAHPTLFARQRLARASGAHPRARERARLDLRNHTRRWIEAVIAPARALGYTAVICREWEQHLGRTPSTQLFVFDAGLLSPPCWLLPPRTASSDGGSAPLGGEQLAEQG